MNDSFRTRKNVIKTSHYSLTYHLYNPHSSEMNLLLRWLLAVTDSNLSTLNVYFELISPEISDDSLPLMALDSEQSMQQLIA